MDKNATNKAKMQQTLCCTPKERRNKSNKCNKKKALLCCSLNSKDSKSYNYMQQMQQNIYKKCIGINICIEIA